MIVLDTTVVSELMRPSPAPAVERWVATHPCRITLRSSDLLQPIGKRAGII